METSHVVIHHLRRFWERKKMTYCRQHAVQLLLSQGPPHASSTACLSVCSVLYFFMQGDFLRQVNESPGGGGGKAVLGDLSSRHRFLDLCCSGEVKRNGCLICSWLVLLSVSRTTKRDCFIWLLSEGAPAPA